jgi:hypothetical protein
VILLLSRDHVSALLDPARPELAIFAVWACCRGHGPEARRVATRAIELTQELPGPLREAQSHAILAMLSQQLLASLEEMAMDVDKIPETKASRAFRQLFEARAKRDAVLAVLATRGLSPTEKERASIAALTDLAVLDRCIQAAVTAPSVGAVLAGTGSAHRRRAAPARTHKPRAVKHPSRRR